MLVSVCFVIVLSVPGPCDPEDLIDGIIFAASFLGSTQLLSEKTPDKSARMQQAQEAMSRVQVRLRAGDQARTVIIITISRIIITIVIIIFIINYCYRYYLLLFSTIINIIYYYYYY